MVDTAGRILVIGVGNALRGDDGAGRAATARLRGRLPRHVDVIDIDGEASALIAAWSGYDAVFLLDAAHTGAAAGTVTRIDASRSPLAPGTLGMSTHALGVAEGVELARALGKLPERVIVYGVEAVDFTAGAPLSRAVAAGVEAVVERVLEELAAG